MSRNLVGVPRASPRTTCGGTKCHERKGTRSTVANDRKLLADLIFRFVDRSVIWCSKHASSHNDVEVHHMGTDNIPS